MIRPLARLLGQSDRVRLRIALVDARAFIAAERDVLLRTVGEVGPDGTVDRASIAGIDRPAVRKFDNVLARIDDALATSGRR